MSTFFLSHSSLSHSLHSHFHSLLSFSPIHQLSSNSLAVPLICGEGSTERGPVIKYFNRDTVPAVQSVTLYISVTPDELFCLKPIPAIPSSSSFHSSHSHQFSDNDWHKLKISLPVHWISSQSCTSAAVKQQKTEISNMNNLISTEQSIMGTWNVKINKKKVFRHSL